MRYVLLFISLSISLIAKGQYFPVYSQYLLNGLLINPAYAGSRDVFSASVTHRNQWTGFEGAPVSSILSGHLPLRNKSIALGLVVSNEKIGISNNFSFFGNYAFRFRISKGFLSFGLKAGFNLIKEDQSKITIREQGDSKFDNTSNGYFLPNFGFGVYYYNNEYFLGAAIPSFLTYQTKSSGDGYEPYNNSNNYNILATAGVLLGISETLKIKPSTLIRYHAYTPLLFDLNCNFILLKDGALSVGLSYRSKSALVGLIEYQLNTQIRCGYSYDYAIGALKNYSNGSHEITLLYEFKYKIRAINPKFF